jgi:hypothetical protein
MEMVSEKQLIANRENAKKGGVKTEAGKDIVRLNALKHGLFAENLLLPGEDEHVLTELWEAVMAELQPQGALEEMLVMFIVSSFWRWQMAVELETDYLSEEFVQRTIAIGKGDALASSKFVRQELRNNNAWMNLVRYQTTFANKFLKFMHELERLQREAIDRQFEMMATDAHYQREARRITDEYASPLKDPSYPDSISAQAFFSSRILHSMTSLMSPGDKVRSRRMRSPARKPMPLCTPALKPVTSASILYVPGLLCQYPTAS